MTDQKSRHSEGQVRDEPRTRGLVRVFRKLLVPMLFDFVILIAGFYVLRECGFSAFVALILGGAPTVVFTIYEMWKYRKIDFIAMMVLFSMIVGVATTLWTGSIRFMLAKEGLLAATIGLFFLASLLINRPLAFTIARDLFNRIHGRGNNWDSLWNGYRVFAKCGMSRPLSGALVHLETRSSLS